MRACPLSAPMRASLDADLLKPASGHTRDLGSEFSGSAPALGLPQPWPAAGRNLLRDSRPEGHSWSASRSLAHRNCNKPPHAGAVFYATEDNKDTTRALSAPTP